MPLASIYGLQKLKVCLKTLFHFQHFDILVSNYLYRIAKLQKEQTHLRIVGLGMVVVFVEYAYCPDAINSHACVFEKYNSRRV